MNLYLWKNYVTKVNCPPRLCFQPTFQLRSNDDFAGFLSIFQGSDIRAMERTSNAQFILPEIIQS